MGVDLPDNPAAAFCEGAARAGQSLDARRLRHCHDRRLLALRLWRLALRRQVGHHARRGRAQALRLCMRRPRRRCSALWDIASIWAFVGPKYPNAPQNVPLAVVNVHLVAPQPTYLHSRGIPMSAASDVSAATRLAVPRLDWKEFRKIVPEFATAMAAITHALKKSGIEPEIRELIKIRASQLNGCAFCIQFHLNDARKTQHPGGKARSAGRLARSRHIHRARDAALEWTEHVTLLAQHHIDDEAFARVKAHFPGASWRFSPSPSARSMPGIGLRRRFASRRRFPAGS